jgi:hypothetical protein
VANLRSKLSKGHLFLTLGIILGIIGSASYLKSRPAVQARVTATGGYDDSGAQSSGLTPNRVFYPSLNVDSRAYNRYASSWPNRPQRNYRPRFNTWRRTASGPWVWSEDRPYYYIHPRDYDAQMYWLFTNQTDHNIMIYTYNTEIFIPAHKQVWVRKTPTGRFRIASDRTGQDTFQSYAPEIDIYSDADSGLITIQPS